MDNTDLAENDVFFAKQYQLIEQFIAENNTVGLKNLLITFQKRIEILQSELDMVTHSLAKVNQLKQYAQETD